MKSFGRWAALAALLATFAAGAQTLIKFTSFATATLTGAEYVYVVQGAGCAANITPCGDYKTTTQAIANLSTAPSFGTLNSGTNVTATMVVGSGSTLSASGSGSIVATTSAALAGTPSQCTGSQVPTGILANGNATGCFTPSGSGNLSGSGTIAQYQTAVFASSTTILAVGPGTSGQAFVSNGGAANPSYSSSLPGVTSVNGTSIAASVTLTQTIASGATALGTGSISSGACASAVTVSASGVATTDILGWSFNADPTSTVGYQPSTAGMLTIISYPTSGNINFKVCNNTGSSVTPGAVTLNWRVVR